MKTTTDFITDYDLYLLQEGKHYRAYEKLGAHLTEQDGVKGAHFAVWAPNCSRVSVVGDFNNWNGNASSMHMLEESGIWAAFVPGVKKGMHYKYEMHSREGNLLVLKSDPFAFYAEQSPGSASIVWPLPQAASHYQKQQRREDPISIYEVHLGSWRRHEGNLQLSYQELAKELVDYVKWMGFTHIECLPIAEHPFEGSWGYQPTGLYAPTSRLGTPEAFLALVNAAHEAGIYVILDWVPAHFPNDLHGLADFDGTKLYEHLDPRLGKHKDWNTLIYNYGRTEVANFLIANAHFWYDRYGIDGLRVDAVASMIYRNYSRREGEWVPNIHGGVENLEATAFLRHLNETLYHHFPDNITIAEESTAWPGVSLPTYTGGLGFGFKWNMGWMHDTLLYMSKDPVYRKHHHHLMTFGLMYAFAENFVLPLSHDEVVHGKGSLINKMPGDEWQKFANLRAYFGFMYGHPGKKLLFMGGEFAQTSEWNHDRSLDWHLLQYPLHHGMQLLVRDLNHLYRGLSALHEKDCEQDGFEWLASGAVAESVYAFCRKGIAPKSKVIVVSNFTPLPRYGYRIAVPEEGYYREVLNTDSAIYGGSNIGNYGGVHSERTPHHGRPFSLVLTLPPLATVFLVREEQ